LWREKLRDRRRRKITTRLADISLTSCVSGLSPDQPLTSPGPNPYRQLRRDKMGGPLSKIRSVYSPFGPDSQPSVWSALSLSLTRVLLTFSFLTELHVTKRALITDSPSVREPISQIGCCRLL